MPRPSLRALRLRDAALAMIATLASMVGPARGAPADWPNDPMVNVPVCTAGNAQINPNLASGGAGGAFIAWMDARTDANFDLYASRVLADGSLDPLWPSSGHVVCATSGSQFNFRLLADGSGGAYVVWQDTRSGTGDIYAHHLLRSGPDPAWPVNGLAVCTAQNNQVLPEIATDGADGALVVWWDYRRGSEYDLYAHRLLLQGSVDSSWPADGMVVCAVMNDQRYARLVPDGSGGAITAWMDYRGGAETDLYAHHILGNGTLDPTWPVTGLSLCASAGNQSLPVLATDGSGGALIAWIDYRAGATPDIYSAHVLATGAVDPNWPTDGRALCTAVGEQSAPTIVETLPGDAVVAWMDLRSGVYYDIYAQRASGPDGGAWAVDGVAVCTGFGTKRNPRAAADGTGGAIITWYDNRTDLGDIYAQHLLGQGGLDPAWPAGGRAVSTRSGFQQEPRILADGAGGAIVTWASLDIYAQRVQANGQLGGTVVDVPAAAAADFSLDPVHPNPLRGGPLTVRFSLAHEANATLELMDLAGRRLVSRELGVLGPGSHTADLAPGVRIPAGLYFVRLRSGDGARSVRVAILD